MLFRHTDVSMMKTRAASRRPYAARVIDGISPRLSPTLWMHPEPSSVPAHCVAASTSSAARGAHPTAALHGPQGIRSHANRLFALGAATRLRNAVRLCGSFHRMCRARCAIWALCMVGGWGLDDLLQARSRRGMCALSMACQEDTRRPQFTPISQAFKWRGAALQKRSYTVGCPAKAGVFSHHRDPRP